MTCWGDVLSVATMKKRAEVFGELTESLLEHCESEASNPDAFPRARLLKLGVDAHEEFRSHTFEKGRAEIWIENQSDSPITIPGSDTPSDGSRPLLVKCLEENIKAIAEAGETLKNTEINFRTANGETALEEPLYFVKSNPKPVELCVDIFLKTKVKVHVTFTAMIKKDYAGLDADTQVKATNVKKDTDDKKDTNDRNDDAVADKSDS